MRWQHPLRGLVSPGEFLPLIEGSEFEVELSRWVMRSVVIYTILACFAALWFIPLFFYYWDTYLWVTGCTVAGVVFSGTAFLYLLNAWIKGITKFFKNKAVF